jgi:hypothetical protein
MPVTLSVIPSGLTAAILDGTIPIRNAGLQMFEAKSVDKNSRAMLGLEFDIGEMSFATFLKAREDGVPLVGLPIFTGRRFSHPCISFHRGAGISALADLSGKRVGVPQYWLTSSVWQSSRFRCAAVRGYRSGAARLFPAHRNSAHHAFHRDEAEHGATSSGTRT